MDYALTENIVIADPGARKSADAAGVADIRS
jgi:hypothetical protein